MALFCITGSEANTFFPRKWANCLRRRKRRKVAANHGVDLRTAALQFSAAPDVASALVVGCRKEQQILADYTSMRTKIPSEFWADLKAQNLIEQNAPVPQEMPVAVG
jgi:D-threo-aldose 1-dehydrogenase